MLSSSSSVAAAEAKYREVYSEEGKQVLILFATEYGFSEEVPHIAPRHLWHLRFRSRVILKITSAISPPQVSRKLFDGLYAPPQCQPRLVNARDRDVFDLEKEQVLFRFTSHSRTLAH